MTLLLPLPNMLATICLTVSDKSKSSTVSDLCRSQIGTFACLSRILLVLFTMSFVLNAQAREPVVNKNWRSIAIGGYDPVAYFTMDKAVEGKSQFEYRWQDARWRFVSDNHLKLFAETPEKYAPRFGGYCAVGMARGRKAKADPTAWLIIDGKLYLNYNNEAREIMTNDPMKTLEKAEPFWTRLVRLFR